MMVECVERQPISSESEQIVRLSRLLGQSCGFERSLKLSRGALDASRFLISAPLGGVSRPVLARMFDALKDIGIPAAFEEEMKQRVGDASFIHFGYEETVSGPVCKTYLEFDGQGADDERPLVHVSFKWEIHSPARNGADEYRRLPPLGKDALDAIVEGHAASLPQSDAPFAEASRRLIELLLSHGAARDFYALEVRRRDGERASFDFRTYEFDVRVAEIAPLIRPLVHASQGAEFAHYMREYGQAALGHVAFGAGNDGRGFLTVYHGGKELA